MTVKTFIFNPIQENTYVVFDETQEAIIIDAGCVFDNEYKQLDGFIEYNKLKVKHLLNTHLHFDHQLGNKYIAEKYGVLPQAHIADEFMIASLGETLKSFGVPIFVEGQHLGNYLDENQTISFGNTELKTLHVPGHSPGSLCFYSEKDKLLFSGDVLFRGTIGRTDFPYGNYAQLVEGIQNKILTLPEDTLVYAGHGASTTIAYEKQMNPYL
jgi:glyoxylase-like metal-dependent hydrolase (beta-lactamase superfamily II)